jgi:hypothetical protein
VILLFGPCMFVAPLLVVLIPVAIVLWPPALLILGALWLLTWPLAAMSIGVRAHAALGRWFVVLLRPWRYFETPTAPSAPAGQAPPPPESSDTPKPKA